MTRKPVKRNQSLKHRLITFSPFARSIAMATSSHRARQEVQKPKLQNKDLATSSGMIFVSFSCFISYLFFTLALFFISICLSIVNGFVSHDKDKSPQSDSSDDEEFEVGLVTIISPVSFDCCYPAPVRMNFRIVILINEFFLFA